MCWGTWPTVSNRFFFHLWGLLGVHSLCRGSGPLGTLPLHLGRVGPARTPSCVREFEFTKPANKSRLCFSYDFKRDEHVL